MSNFGQKCNINLTKRFLRFVQFGGLAILLKRTDKLKFGQRCDVNFDRDLSCDLSKFDQRCDVNLSEICLRFEQVWWTHHSIEEN